MTPDECFNAMAEALGMENPKDVGYLVILQEVKKLKEKNTQLREWVDRNQDEINRLRDVVDDVDDDDEEEKLREENNKLKEKNKKLKEKFEKLKKKFVEIPDALNGGVLDLMVAKSKELMEEKEKLKTEAEDVLQQVADALCGEGEEADGMCGWGQTDKLIEKAKEMKEYRTMDWNL